MPASEGPRAHRIVVGTDRPPSSHEALRLAVRRAALTGAVLDTTIARRAQSGYDGWERLIEDTGYASLAPTTFGEAADRA